MFDSHLIIEHTLAQAHTYQYSTKQKHRIQALIEEVLARPEFTQVHQWKKYGLWIGSFDPIEHPKIQESFTYKLSNKIREIPLDAQTAIGILPHNGLSFTKNARTIVFLPQYAFNVQQEQYARFTF
ncbi:MAG: hypothetical protein ACMXYF_05835 [Candidatus Woesearchaeota archaeon]